MHSVQGAERSYSHSFAHCLVTSMRGFLASAETSSAALLTDCEAEGVKLVSTQSAQVRHTDNPNSDTKSGRLTKDVHHLTNMLCNEIAGV